MNVTCMSVVCQARKRLRLLPYSRETECAQTTKIYFRKGVNTMKKFSKAIIALAAAGSLSAAMAVCASAANELTAVYDASEGTVAITGFTVQDQNTMVVLSGDDTTITADTIKAIDQQAGAEDVYSAVVVGTLADGTYTVKVGGTDGTIETGTFTVGGTSVLLGDADDNGAVEVTDATIIVDVVLDKNTCETYNAKNADADQNGTIEVSDATVVVDIVSGKA